MSDESVSDFAYGIALTATVVAAVSVFGSSVVLFWTADDLPLAAWVLPPLAITAFWMVRLHRRGKKGTAEDEEAA